MFQFRSLETRIVVFFVILLVLVQVTALALVGATIQSIARSEVASQLAVGERVFNRVLEQRGRQLSQAAAVLAADFGFREAVATRDLGTIRSVLENHGGRIKANAVILVGLDNRVIADSPHSGQAGNPFVFAELIAEAQQRREASEVVLIAGRPHQLVVTPVLAPVAIAWIAMGFEIDDRLAKDIQGLTSMQVSFLTRAADQSWRLGASTFAEELRDGLVSRAAGAAAATAVSIGGDEYETRLVALQRRGAAEVVAILQQSLTTALEPFNQLRATLLILALASVIASLAGSILIGRSVIQPINRLANVARKMRDGDYSQAIQVKQRDEIGELASSFEHMREAISTREQKILRLAYQDTLTALPNRALFNDRLDLAIKAAQRTSAPLTMLMMDLDRFKYVNDTLGHQVGDRVLQEVGVRLQVLLRKSDTVARLGGDEFAMILPGASEEQIREVVQTILRAMEKPITLDGQPLDVGASIGIATYPDHGSSAQQLASHADVAMYEAKRGNKGYAVFRPEQYKPREDYLSLLGELRRAVERDELVLHYQPKVNLCTGGTTQVEALLRWIHPQRGFVPPGDFIPFAEQTGYVRAITAWIVRRALRQCREWKDKGLDLTVSLNISTRDLINPELPNVVAAELAASRVEPDRLCLEITESGFMEDPAHALEILSRLNALGVGLSIDDYGAGFSSLSYIRKLPVGELKIDQSFVTNLARNSEDAIIVKSTIDLGHNMGLKVVAEGVEDRESWELLRRLGCDHAQGYYMSKPLAADRLEVWLTTGAMDLLPAAEQTVPGSAVLISSASRAS